MKEGKHVRAEISFDLPGDPGEEADALATVAAAWKQFSDTVRGVPGIRLWGQSFNLKKTHRFGQPRIQAVKSGDAA
jgi:hypothetical protein